MARDTVASALYAGSVMHQRMRPARHRLQYRVFSLLLDIDELPALAKRLRLFSLNRFNLFSLHERDYGSNVAGNDGAGLRAYVEQQLRASHLPTGGAIRLLTMPRILGYAFNPLSVYFCHAVDGTLAAILYEVNNTFGERHSYLIGTERGTERRTDPDGQSKQTIVQRCAKQFHVSPFLELDMNYTFRVDAPDAQREGLSIGVIASDTQGPMLNARFDAQRQPLSDAALARVFITHPLLTLKVVAAIHWEALRLLVKGVRLRARPASPVHPVTVIKPQDS
jgi:DUF1365 family protein